ncbi:MAG: hypothetical protein OXI73_03345 [Rhodospirillales bacterium]|nr:hypothetical protein [Rhodospirillales bacterium]
MAKPIAPAINPDLFSHLDKVPIGKVCVTGSRPVSAVPKDLADQREPLTRHDRLTGGCMP